MSDLSEKSASNDSPKPARIRAVPAVTRAVAILRLLGDRSSGLGVKAIADQLELIPSTCLHILRVLVAENIVRQDPDSKRYKLASGMVSLARAALDTAEFAKAARPALEGVAARWGITAMGVELTKLNSMVVMIVARPDQPLQLHANLGSEFPSLTSATGRLVAAHSGLAEGDLRGQFRKVQWDRKISFEQWMAEVEQARARGWSMDQDSFRNGITALAVPVLNDGDAMTHSLVAMGLSSEMELIDHTALLRDLQDAALTISKDLVPG